MSQLDEYAQSDLGNNVYHLYDLISKVKNGVLVDCGIRHGWSTKIMLLDAVGNNNKVFGIEVDPKFSNVDKEITDNTNFTFILGESATVGKNWSGLVDGLFIDTVHIKEQAMIELRYWLPHIIEGGFIGFHDTGWTGDHYDTHGGIVWDRVDDGIKAFFDIDSLNYSDEFIECRHYPESWGMTLIKVKKKNTYSQIINWSHIYDKRNYLMQAQWGSLDMGNCNIEFNMKP